MRPRAPPQYLVAQRPIPHAPPGATQRRLTTPNATSGRHLAQFARPDAIPGIAIEQMEVLRDGAAAQYGSDVIAGVVNFRLKDNREGVSLEAKYGVYEGSSAALHT